MCVSVRIGPDKVDIYTLAPLYSKLGHTKKTRGEGGVIFFLYFNPYRDNIQKISGVWGRFCYPPPP